MRSDKKTKQRSRKKTRLTGPRKQVCSGPQPTVSQQLVESHIKFARKIAHRFYHERGNRFIDPEELMGAALLGLCEAATRFDPERHTNFATYAFLRIRGAMYDFLRISGQRSRSDYRRIMAENNQQAPSIEERIGIVTVELAANGVTLHSQGKWSELDMSSSMTPETALLELDLRQRLAHYLTTLPPREAEVIRMKYLNEKTLEEIRPRFGVSRSMVCRLHTDGLYTLKKLFTENCKPVPAQPSPVQSNSVQYQTAA